MIGSRGMGKRWERTGWSSFSGGESRVLGPSWNSIAMHIKPGEWLRYYKVAQLRSLRGTNKRKNFSLSNVPLPTNITTSRLQLLDPVRRRAKRPSSREPAPSTALLFGIARRNRRLLGSRCYFTLHSKGENSGARFAPGLRSLLDKPGEERRRRNRGTKSQARV